MNKPKVSFTPQSQQEKAELGEYAKARGFANIGALARFALFQYVNRYPVKKGAGRTASER